MDQPVRPYVVHEAEIVSREVTSTETKTVLRQWLSIPRPAWTPETADIVGILAGRGWHDDGTGVMLLLAIVGDVRRAWLASPMLLERVWTDIGPICWPLDLPFDRSVQAMLSPHMVKKFERDAEVLTRAKLEQMVENAARAHGVKLSERKTTMSIPAYPRGT